MTTLVRSLAVNAAFLREIKEDHHDLHRLLDEAASRFDAEHLRTEGSAARAADLAQRLCDQLALHFSLEEAYGYFENAVTAAPALSRRAEELRGQHAELYERSVRLAEEAAKLRYHEQPNVRQVPRVVAAYAEFRGAFDRHEAEEYRLILESLENELGAGD